MAEAQIANKEYKNALSSLNKAEQINSNISEIYFAKSNIYLKISQQTKAKFIYWQECIPTTLFWTV